MLRPKWLIINLDEPAYAFLYDFVTTSDLWPQAYIS